MKWFVILLLVAGAGAGVLFFGPGRDLARRDAPVRFRTVKIDQGEVIEGVQASGAIQPLLLVQVGTQISGTIETIHKDWNSKVTEGDTIAVLDSRRLVAQVAQDQATLGRARADVERVRAQVLQAQRALERQRRLAENNYSSETDLDTAIANYDSLRAQLEVAAAVVSQSVAQLDGDLVNLRYATIKSPISGVVISRKVDVGQTVAASLSTPTLFEIANDLSKIQVQANITEADIGRIREGQRARFSVDAYPERQFEGTVSQVRLAATTVQNVVTYTVLIDASNPNAVLFPGMTANATFEIARSPKSGLKVAASALRYTPAPELVEADEAPAKSAEKPDGEKPTEKPADKPEDGAKPDDGAKPEARPDGARRGGREGGRPDGARRGGREGGRRPDGSPPKPRILKLWVRVAPGASLLKAIPVKALLSDGIMTAIEPLDGNADALVGVEAVTGIAREEEEATRNPFAPQMPGGGRRGLR